MRLSIYAQSLREQQALTQKAPRARYDAARLYQGPDRSMIWSQLGDARYDQQPADRKELLRKIIYFEQNTDICQKIGDAFETFTVGPEGIVMPGASADEQWNAQRSIFLDEFSKDPDRSCRTTLSERQNLSARLLCFHGEFFILKTRRATPPFLPRLQLIEGIRVNTPSNMAEQEGVTIIDGVEVDQKGKPIAYWIADGMDPNQYRRVPDWAVTHCFDPSRVGVHRGITPFYACLNTLHDLDDLMRMEMQVAKDQADTSEVIKTKTGELDDASDWSSENTAATGDPEKLIYYRQVFGPSTRVLRHGDEVDKSGPERPTVVQQWYWRHLNEKVCNAVGIPLQMIYPESMQGTSLRAVYDQANGFFRSKFSLIASAWKDALEYVVEEGSRFDTRIAPLPADWRKVRVRAPRAVNVDVGRNSNAMLAELKAGTRTLSSVCAELGDDWREVIDQRATEIEYLHKTEARRGIKASELTDMLPKEEKQNATKE